MASPPRVRRFPVPIQPTSEPGTLKFADEEVEIRFRQPRRKTLRYHTGIEERLRFVEQETPALFGRGSPDAE
jgi:hypothetical protein